jgi:hypothetical protein
MARMDDAHGASTGRSPFRFCVLCVLCGQPACRSAFEYHVATSNGNTSFADPQCCLPQRTQRGGSARSKLEIPNPKCEGNPNAECGKLEKGQKCGQHSKRYTDGITNGRKGKSLIRVSSLEFRISFGFRIWDFGFLTVIRGSSGEQSQTTDQRFRASNFVLRVSLRNPWR